jgi:catechol-2,3-dioxygenase
MKRTGLCFSHFGIYVHDLPTMEYFYSRVLDFTVTDRGQLETAQGEAAVVFLSRDPDEHHQIILMTGRPAALPFNIINQLSFRADSLATLKTMLHRVTVAGATDITPITHGNALSVYLRDPEGNRLELYIDLPWYVVQPMRVPIDLSGSDEAIMGFAEQHARSLPGFQLREVWRAAMASRMGVDE